MCEVSCAHALCGLVLTKASAVVTYFHECGDLHGALAFFFC